IPGQVQQAFQATGTAHIIAISGQIAIVAGLFVTIFGKLLGKRRGALAAALGIALYSVLVGPSASVLRAALMGGLGLLARQVGRRQDGLNSLAFVAAVLAVFNPNILGDEGFQLSFMATLGLVLYAEPFTQAFARVAARVLSPSAVRSVAGPVGEYFLFTLAAQLTTLPVTLYHFQRLSPVSLLANPAVLPAQPAVMVLGGMAVLLGLVWQPLGQIAAWLAWPFVLYTIRVVEFFARLPAANLVLGEVTLPVVVLLYAVLFGVTGVVALRRAGRLPNLNLTLPAAVPGLALAVLAAGAVLAWQMGLAAPDGRLHLTLISSGGDAILLQTPAGRYVLVNGGPSPNSLSDALGRRLPVFQRQLDFVVVAGAEEEQLRALPPTVKRYPVANVLWSGAEAKSRSASDLGQALAAKHIPITQAQPGHRLDLGDGAALRILAAGQRGAVLLLEWKNFHALLPIGMDEAALQALQASQLPVPLEALLLAGSGSAALNPPDWIARLQPQVVLLSPVVGGKRLPDPATLAALQDYMLLRTDRNGWIELSTDGEQMWVEVEKRGE
ncbi:MAG TPA: ComEC/Rec2 family competence protein, partial [Anaerolineales bacterium]